MNDDIKLYQAKLECLKAELEFPVQPIRFQCEDLPKQNDIFLKEIEDIAHKQNIYFNIYNHCKTNHDIKLSPQVFDEISRTNKYNNDDLGIVIDLNDDNVFVNGKAIEIAPLMGEKVNNKNLSTSFIDQRYSFLQHSISNQRMFVYYDSKDADKHDPLNTDFNQKKANDALRELAADENNVNIDGFFKTDLPKSLKIRMLLNAIDDLSKNLPIQYSTASKNEREFIKSVGDRKKTNDIAQSLANNDGSVNKLLHRHQFNPDIAPEHKYITNSLDGDFSIVDNNHVHIGHLRQIPNDYELLTERVSHKLSEYEEPIFSKNNDVVTVLANFYKMYDSINDELNYSYEDISFDTSVPSTDNLYVVTYNLKNNRFVEGESCFIDANGKCVNYSSGDFGLPKNSILKKPISDYENIVVGTDVVSTSFISKSLEDSGDTLVIDALDERNVVDVIRNIRDNTDKDITVFTNNSSVDQHLITSEDFALHSKLSDKLSWGKLGLKNYKEQSIDVFDNIINSRINDNYSEFDLDKMITISSINTLQNDNTKEKLDKPDRNYDNNLVKL